MFIVNVMLSPRLRVPEGGIRSNFVAKVDGTHMNKADITKKKYKPIDFLLMYISL